jgi:hypothetical protein
VAALGICNLVFIWLTWYLFFLNHLYFAKTVALLPCIEKNIGIHLNSKKYPWRRPWAWYVTRLKMPLFMVRVTYINTLTTLKQGFFFSVWNKNTDDNHKIRFFGNSSQIS